MEGWTVVQRKGRRGVRAGRGNKRPLNSGNTPKAEDSSLPVDIERISLQIERERGKLATSPLLAHCVAILNTALPAPSTHAHQLAHVQFLCYGLGTPSTSLTSRSQLAFLLTLANNTTATLHAYDPVFSTGDLEVLDTHGVRGGVESDGGHRGVTGPTVFFMPHCDKPLYTAVIRANLEVRNTLVPSPHTSASTHTSPPRPLECLAIIGNSFASYEMRRMGGECDGLLDCLAELRAMGVTIHEIPIPPSLLDTADQSLNDTSIHYFRYSNSLARAENE